jgi:hypothetical protein
VRTWDLIASLESIEENEEGTGEFVLREDHEKAIAEAGQSTYTDDTIAVMRDTISALRIALAEERRERAHLEACNEQLRIAETECMREIRNLRARLAASPLPEGM